MDEFEWMAAALSAFILGLFALHCRLAIAGACGVGGPLLRRKSLRCALPGSNCVDGGGGSLGAGMGLKKPRGRAGSALEESDSPPRHGGAAFASRPRLMDIAAR